MEIQGDPSFIFCNKLKNLKMCSRDWNKVTFDDIHQNVELTDQELVEVQHVLDKERDTLVKDNFVKLVPCLY